MNSQPVSWIHIGDPHITKAGEQNEIHLGKIIDEINKVYAGKGVDFVFLPGDIADDGSAAAYRAVRTHLDRLNVPWCAIVGDHDVHERTFANFQAHVNGELWSAFTIGEYRFIRLNAFSEPRPDSFMVSDEQLDWLERELGSCSAHSMWAVLLLHCYPSDLKQGGAKLSELLRRYPVLLVDMGHTHYNEISNDGTVLYSATRSTGQIEEGPPGYSVITLDEGVVSWHFVRLGSPGLAAITSPADHRLLTARTHVKHTHAKPASSMKIRAKIWSRQTITAAAAKLESQQVNLSSMDGMLWKGEMQWPEMDIAPHHLLVTAEDGSGAQLSSGVWLVTGELPARTYHSIDQENAIGAWTERDILGTQLGPNKNGRKW